MELKSLQARLAELKTRQPTMQTGILVGGRWQIEMALLQSDIASYLLRQ